MSEWINVDKQLPENLSRVIAYDTDSMTPEKELVFKNGKFLYCAHGEELDYTAHISKWKPIRS